ncbi:MAG: EamA family transporter [Devosia sp.]|uniref:EamA family transporter n=1 Tax=Devosia sp. TaxID=1871048 RepID=UPI00262BD79B|nr:EamA family transporter [Devosia sp.]MDB5588428.1 EamA family transporter [Devosia sp.]
MRPSSIILPVTLIALGMVATQIGASLAKGLFPAVGASGATALRLTLAALVLLALFRPWRHKLDARQWRAVLLYGAAMGAMNLLFYGAIARIPLGIAVALEFTGPLAVALAGSRKPLDFVWIAMALLGFVALLPFGKMSGALDPFGIALALATGICWAGYIVFGQRAGTGGGPHIAALGVGLAAIIALPFGIAEAGMALIDPAILPIALGVALLSSAIPYTLDMIALPHIPTRLFSILASAHPGLAAIAGFIILSERLSPSQIAGIACIVLASIGGTATIARSQSPPIA